MEGKMLYNFQEMRKTLMVLTGVKILKNSQPKKTLNIIYLVLLTISLICQIILSIWTIIMSIGNISMILEAIQFIVSLLIITFGLMNAVYRRNDLDEAAIQIDNGIFVYKEGLTKEQIQIQLNGVKEITFMTKWFTIYIIFSGLSYLLFVPLKELISPSIENHRPINKLLPLPLYMPFDTDNEIGFITAIIIDLICMYCIIVLILSIDEVYISTMVQIRVQFQLLNYSLQNLEIRALKKMKTFTNQEANIENNKVSKLKENNLFKQCIYLCLKENIKHHHQLNRYIKLVQPYLGTTFLIIVALASLIIATTGYLITAYNNTAEELLKFCIVLLSELLFVLHFCWFGEDVAIESEKVFNFIYGTNWYTYNKNINTLIDIMLVNCKKPFRLHSSLYKLPASLETFNSIVSTSYTYLNLLRQSNS